MSLQQPAIMQVVKRLEALVILGQGEAPFIQSNRWDSGALHTPATDRTEVTTRHRIGVDGVLTGVKVRVESGVPQSNVYIEVTLQDNDNNTLQKLFQGYVDVGSEPFGNGAIPVIKSWVIAIRSWSSMGTAPTLTLRGTVRTGKIEPGGWTGTDQSSVDGPGAVITETGTDPAAGAQMTEVVPDGSRRQLQAFSIRLVSDANAATRRQDYQWDDGTLNIDAIAVQATQIESLTRDYFQSYRGLTETAFTTASTPDIHTQVTNHILEAAYRIRTITVNLQVGDNFGAPVLNWKEWLVPSSS